MSKNSNEIDWEWVILMLCMTAVAVVSLLVGS